MVQFRNSIRLRLAVAGFFTAPGWLIALWLGLACARGAEPRPVNPGRLGVAVPSDAIDFFNEDDLTKWQTADGTDAKWDIADGVAAPNGSGGIQTRGKYLDFQLHLEFNAPPSTGSGGSALAVFRIYEIVLNAAALWETDTNVCGSISGQPAPLAQATGRAGEWQTLDLIFHAPRCGPDGLPKTAARITALLNGILLYDNLEMEMEFAKAMPGFKVCDPQPLTLIDKGAPVQHRNLWLREL